MLLHFSIADYGSNVHDHVAAVACEVVDATLTGPQPGVLNATISIIYRRKFRSIIVPKGGDVPKPQDS